MACLNCLNCLEYDEDGNLSAQLAEDGGITCNADGQLTLDTNLLPLSDDLPIPVNTINDCNNGISIVGTRLWRRPSTTVECFSGNFNGFVGPNTIIGENQVYATPTQNIQLPAADPCCNTTYTVAVRRWIEFDQSNGSLYTIQDWLNGSLNQFNNFEGTQLPADANRHLSRHASSFMFNSVQPAGSGPTNLPIQIRVTTFTDPGGAANNGIVYNYGWRWDGVAICT